MGKAMKVVSVGLKCFVVSQGFYPLWTLSPLKMWKISHLESPVFTDESVKAKMGCVFSSRSLNLAVKLSLGPLGL
jgi:hypothetical protein